MTEENMRRFASVIEPLDPVIRGDPRNLKPPLDPKYLAEFKTLIMRTRLGDLDMLADVDPIGRYDAVLSHWFLIDVEGKPTRVLNIDGLIAAKKKTGRPKDKLGVMYLESAKRRREETGQNPENP